MSTPIFIDSNETRVEKNKLIQYTNCFNVSRFCKNNNDTFDIIKSWIFVVVIIFVENFVRFVTSVTTISLYFGSLFYFITVYCTRASSFFSLDF